MGAESGGDSVRKEQMSCGRRVDITAAKRLGIDNRGDSAGFHAARQRRSASPVDCSLAERHA